MFEANAAEIPKALKERLNRLGGVEDVSGTRCGDLDKQRPACGDAALDHDLTDDALVGTRRVKDVKQGRYRQCSDVDDPVSWQVGVRPAREAIADLPCCRAGEGQRRQNHREQLH